MSGKLNKMQVVGPYTWAGLTTDNALQHYIGTAAGKNPKLIQDFMVQLFAFQNGPTCESMLAKVATREFEEDDEYTWSVVGSSRKNIPLIEARKYDGDSFTGKTGVIGANGEIFYLVFPEVYFFEGDFIVGNLNEVYPIRILEPAQMEGDKAVYKCEVHGAAWAGIPAERLQPGEKFSIDAAYIEREMSRKVSDIHFAAPLAMRNEFTTIRKYHKVPGTMLNKQIACGLPIVGENGQKKVEKIWMHYVDYQFEKEFSENKNNALMFGRSNRTATGDYHNIGKSGDAIRIGSGLREQMEVSNVITYNHFSLKVIEKAIYNLTYGKTDFRNRKYVLKTGLKGAEQFSKAVQEIASGWTMFNYNGDNLGVISKTTSNLGQPALKAGFMFSEYMTPSGIVLSVEVDPCYDDNIRNKVLWKDGLAESYRYDILDLGNESEPNIFKCVIKNKPEQRGYQWGPFANPFTGAQNNMSASWDEDSAAIHKKATFGVCVLDPTRVMSIIPAVLQ